MASEQTTDGEAEFERQCVEASVKIMNLLTSYPKMVAVCVLPGVLASVMNVFDMPRDKVIAMLDSALEDLADAP